MEVEVITSSSGADEIIYGAGTTHLVVDEADENVLEEVSRDLVLEAAEDDTLFEGRGAVSILSTGLRFISPVNEDDMTYAKRVDFQGDSVIYRGEAKVGADDASPVWRIRKITVSEDGDVTEQWAGGSANFVHAWLDRTALTYV